jgi:zinc and cadmium transporter
MTASTQAVLGVSFISLLSLIGVLTIRMSTEQLNRLIPTVLSLAVGALLGDAFLHLLPEAYGSKLSPISVGLLVLAGNVAFFLVEHLMRLPRQAAQGGEIKPLGPMSIVANSIHNVVDGMLVGGAFLVSSRLGIATLTAVALHEIPHEAANFGILLHANYTRGTATLINFLVGLGAMLGVFLALLIGARTAAFASFLLPFTAGCFLYLACADLMPSLLKQQNRRQIGRQICSMLIGIGIMFFLLRLE